MKNILLILLLLAAALAVAYVRVAAAVNSALGAGEWEKAKWSFKLESLRKNFFKAITFQKL